MKAILLFGAFLGISLGLWNGCAGNGSHIDEDVAAITSPRVASIHVESGTQIRVALRSPISARTTRPGDAWEGWLAEDAVMLRAGARGAGIGPEPRRRPTADVVVLEEVVIPAGSHVTGVVMAAARDTSRPWAMPTLALKAISVKGADLRISAGAGRVVTESPRPRGSAASVGEADPIVLSFTINEIVGI